MLHSTDGDVHPSCRLPLTQGRATVDAVPIATLDRDEITRIHRDQSLSGSLLERVLTFFFAESTAEPGTDYARAAPISQFQNTRAPRARDGQSRIFQQSTST